MQHWRQGSVLHQSPLTFQVPWLAVWWMQVTLFSLVQCELGFWDMWVLLSVLVDVSCQAWRYTLQLPTVFFLSSWGVLVFLASLLRVLAASVSPDSWHYLLSVACWGSCMLTSFALRLSRFISSSDRGHTMKIVAHALICFGCFMIGEFHLSLHLIWDFFFFGFFKFFCRKVWSKGAVVRINCWVHHIQKFRCFEKNLKQVNRGVFHLSLEHLAWSTPRKSGQGPAVLDHVN